MGGLSNRVCSFNQIDRIVRIRWVCRVHPIGSIAIFHFVLPIDRTGKGVCAFAEVLFSTIDTSGDGNIAESEYMAKKSFRILLTPSLTTLSAKLKDFGIW